MSACEFASECVCFWVCTCILQRLLKWVWGIGRCIERGRMLVLLNYSAPTAWPWGPCVYYLMALCPEWETDPLLARLWRKEELFQCILHSDLSAQRSLGGLSSASQTIGTTNCPTCRLETCIGGMCFVFLCASEKHWEGNTSKRIPEWFYNKFTVRQIHKIKESYWHLKQEHSCCSGHARLEMLVFF